MNKTDILIVGAGFAGAISARVLAESGNRVLIIDRRNHIGGNASDIYDDHGILIHPHGPHIFHTNSKKVFEWLSRFTDWRFYEHRVLADIEGNQVPIPINRTTINKLYRLDLDEKGVELWLEGVREKRVAMKTSEDIVLNSVGKDLCEKFFRGYTRKQWGLDLSELSPSVAARIPTRTTDDNRYFTDAFQFMPAGGYTELFKSILDHPNIEVSLNTDFFKMDFKVCRRHTIYTGPLDAFFGFRFGELPYRSLRFEHVHFENVERYQECGQLNYPGEEPYTRVTEFKHLTGQKHSGTSIAREYPTDSGEPYYPIPRPETELLRKAYENLVLQEGNVSFIGRLAEYRYYNMDQVVASALKTATMLVDRLKIT